MASYQDKLDSSIRLIMDRVGLSNIVPGTTAYQIAQAFAYEAYLQDSNIENNNEDRSILTSAGSKLDDIGSNFFGIERLPEVVPFISSSMQVLQFSASGGRIFGDINSGNDIVLPQGTQVYGTINGLVIKFALTTEQILLASKSTAFVSASLVQGPSQVIPARTLTKHTFTNYTDYNAGSLLVTNTVQINTGRPAESDDTYRYAISAGLRSFNQANSDGILSVVRNVQGVSDATIETAKDGAGTFTVYVRGITPITADETLVDVKTALLQECVSPWVAFNVVKPSYIGLTMTVSISLANNSNINDTAQLQLSIQNTIESYINNFDGATFYFTDLMRLILSMNTNIVGISFSNCYQFIGNDIFRQQISIDPTITQSIQILETEKLIVEPVTTPISVVIT